MGPLVVSAWKLGAVLPRRKLWKVSVAQTRRGSVKSVRVGQTVDAYGTGRSS